MKSASSLLTLNVRWFLLGIVLAALAQNMFTVFIPIYLSQLGASVSQVGMVLSLSSVLRILLQIPTGWLSDTFGRLKIVAIGSGIGFVGLFVMILTKDWKFLLLAISLESISQLALGPNYGPFLMEHSLKEFLGRVMGISEMIFRMVGVVGPLLGGFLASRIGIRNMLLFAALPYFAALLLRIWMARTVDSYPVIHAKNLNIRELLSDIHALTALVISGGLFTWILITKSAVQISYRLSTELLPLYLEHIGEMKIEQISLMLSIFGIAVMIFSFPAGMLSDKYGERLVIILGLILTGFALVIFINVDGFWGYSIAWSAFGAANGLLSPSYMSMISKTIPEKNRGIAFGMVWTTLGLFSLPTAWVGGYLWEKYNPQLPFLLGAMISFMMALAAYLTLREKRRFGKEGS
jgi:MFS family permease